MVSRVDGLVGPQRALSRFGASFTQRNKDRTKEHKEVEASENNQINFPVFLLQTSCFDLFVFLGAIFVSLCETRPEPKIATFAARVSLT